MNRITHVHTISIVRHPTQVLNTFVLVTYGLVTTAVARNLERVGGGGGGGGVDQRK